MSKYYKEMVVSDKMLQVVLISWYTILELWDFDISKIDLFSVDAQNDKFFVNEFCSTMFLNNQSTWKWVLTKKERLFHKYRKRVINTFSTKFLLKQKHDRFQGMILIFRCKETTLSQLNTVGERGGGERSRGKEVKLERVGESQSQLLGGRRLGRWGGGRCWSVAFVCVKSGREERRRRELEKWFSFSKVVWELMFKRLSLWTRSLRNHRKCSLVFENSLT